MQGPRGKRGLQHIWRTVCRVLGHGWRVMCVKEKIIWEMRSETEKVNTGELQKSLYKSCLEVFIPRTIKGFSAGISPDQIELLKDML